MQALLIFAVVLTQTHFCRSTYEFVNGGACAICPSLTDTSEESAHTGELTSTHNDCHDCCVQKPCPDEKAAQTLHFKPYTTAFWMPERIQVVGLPLFESPKPRIVHVDSAPTKGPPEQHSSRAPPSIAASLPSAGRMAAMTA